MDSSDELREAIRQALEEIRRFCRHGGLTLRRYQYEVAGAIVRSVLDRSGLSFVVMFPRQSGKNELQAQLEAFFLLRFSLPGGELVKISPTWKPQSQNAQRRLEKILRSHPLFRNSWVKEQGHIYRIGEARQIFLSGSAEANIVGATASILLQVDEAQDILIEKYDKEIAPMAASTNATRVFWGTAWNNETLLARELLAAQEAQGRDGIRRAFILNADQVAKEVPAYGLFVARQIERLGRDNPMVRTQYFSEPLDDGGGLFHEGRIALMQGDHALEHHPSANQVYALLLDVAGEDAGLSAGGSMENPGRDYSALTVVRIEAAMTGVSGTPLATYRVVNRKSWQGIPQTRLFEEMMAQTRLWKARRIVVDATGVGNGLANFLSRDLPGRVIPFVFSVSSKSQLGWDFISLIESGRFKDYRDHTAEKDAFIREARACKHSVSTGPQKHLHWSVPPATRDRNGHLIHDDWLISAALCAALDKEILIPALPTQIIRAKDPLKEMDEVR